MLLPLSKALKDKARKREVVDPVAPDPSARDKLAWYKFRIGFNMLRVDTYMYL